MPSTMPILSQRPVFLGDVQPRSGWLQSWQRLRNGKARWLVECLAEAWGAFVYTYLGTAATAAYVTGNTLGLVNSGSFLTVSLSYAVGVAFALIMVAPTSGGHINCGVTICFVLFHGFPKLKAIRYIVSQLLGAYIACLIVYVQWYDTIKQAEAVLAAAGTLESTMFTGGGSAGILAFFVPESANLGRMFLNELVTDFFIGMIIWTALDASHSFLPPAAGFWAIGLGFGVAIWSSGSIGLGANTARDMGGRLAALTIYGTAASGGKYAAISALTNIFSYASAYIFYEMVLKDTTRVVTSAHKEVMDGRAAQLEYTNSSDCSGNTSPNSDSLSEKGSVTSSDRAAAWV